VQFVEVLPLVVVMVSGPQILSAIFLATSRRWRANSAAFLAGAALSIPLVVGVAYTLDVGVVGRGQPSMARTVLVLLVLVVAMGHTYRTRESTGTPRWMESIESASPRSAFRLGFLLMGFFPTDLLTSIAVGSYLSGRDAPFWHAIPFVAATLVVLALPSIALVASGERAERALPVVRTWMDDNSWIVSEIVLAFFVAMTVSNVAP